MHTRHLLSRSCSPLLLLALLPGCLSGESSEQVDIDPAPLSSSLDLGAGGADMNDQVEEDPCANISCDGQKNQVCKLSRTGQPRCECDDSSFARFNNASLECIKGESCDARDALERCENEGRCVKLTLDDKNGAMPECVCGEAFVGIEDGWRGSRCTVAQCSSEDAGSGCMPRCEAYKDMCGIEGDMPCGFSPEGTPMPPCSIR